MTIVKPKRKIGGIEEIYSPDTFFGLLGWTDRKFENFRVRFNISAQQGHVLEIISKGIHAGSMMNVARAVMSLGTLVEANEKGRHGRIADRIIKDLSIHSIGENAERVADKLLHKFNFSSTELLDELKSLIERYGNNKLSRYLWNKIQSSYPYNCSIKYHPRIKDIKGFISGINWGCVPLDDNKRFKLWRTPENVQVEFRCTKRITKMSGILNDEFYRFPQAKFSRGVFVKGLYILAIWFKNNDKTVAEWYSIARLIGKLDELDIKAY